MLTFFGTKVVGVTFNEKYPDNIFALSRDFVDGDDSVDLVREPNNEFDENAIVVSKNGEQIGHLSRHIAKFLAPQIDAGVRWRAAIERFVMSTINCQSPGLMLTVWREDVI